MIDPRPCERFDGEHLARLAVDVRVRGAFLELSESEPITEDFEARALALLVREIGCETAFFFVKGLEARPAVIGIESSLIADAVRPGSEYERELGPVQRAALAARGVAVDTDVLGEAAVRRTKYFRELASRVKGRHSLMAYLRWRGQPRGAVMLGRSGSSFSTRDVERIESALPELAAARAIHGWPFLEAALPERPGRPWLPRGLRFGGELARVRTDGGSISVRDQGGFREMVATSAGRELVWTRANVRSPSESGWPYVELFHVAAALAPQRRRALFIGLGGGVALRQFARGYPGIELDVVESEPHVVELARAWFGLSSIPGVTLHVADGVDFVAHAPPARFDIVIVDAFSTSFAGAFASRGFLANARRVLAPGGAIALNVIGKLDGSADVTALLAAVRAELGQPRIVPVVAADGRCAPGDFRNLVVIAKKA